MFVHVSVVTGIAAAFIDPHSKFSLFRNLGMKVLCEIFLPGMLYFSLIYIIKFLKIIISRQDNGWVLCAIISPIIIINSDVSQLESSHDHCTATLSSIFCCLYWLLITLKFSLDLWLGGIVYSWKFCKSWMSVFNMAVHTNIPVIDITWLYIKHCLIVQIISIN